MKELKIAIKLPDIPLIFGKIKRILIDKKLDIILLLIILSLLVLWEISIDIIVFIMIGSILLLYGWESGVILRTLWKAGKDILRKKLYTILLIIILILFIIWKFSIEAIILWMIFSTFLLYKWNSRILAGIVLAFLVSCPILLISKKEDIAEQMAIYAYYFLVMAVILQIVEYIKDSRIERFKD